LLRLILRAFAFIKHKAKGLVMNVHTADMRRDPAKRLETNSVSFDIFDTFLVRACTNPEGVYERAFQLSPAFALFPDASVAYVEHRRQAEARARKEALQRSGSPEVGIAEIYRSFPFRLFRLTRAALPELVAAEFAAELDLCRANPDVLAKYQEMRATGVRTGFISDTYWSVAQLGELLLRACPGLAWDFLYASGESGTNKSDGLFAAYLAEQDVASDCAVHLGDNMLADIEGARRHGIAGLHLPQASAALTSVLNREALVAKLLCRTAEPRLDGGARTLRRLVASRVPARSGAFDLGATVLGPVMHAFDTFVADRVAALDGGGATTCVAFLGRDGFLSQRVWHASRTAPAVYLEINRRVGMIASADTLAPLIDLIDNLPAIDAPTFAAIAKCLPPGVAAFLARCPDGIATGRKLAAALPDLLDEQEIGTLAADLRSELMTYLRAQLPDLDGCTDLVLVDLGYSGSIQKALRRIFDIEGVTVRLHGLYLLTLDDGFVECSDDDSYEGLISDIVVTPHVKRMLLRNVALLEQLCCASAGSVLGYRDGGVLHEAHLQSDEQAALAGDAQAGALEYVAAAAALAPILGISPHGDLERAARTAAATLGRLLLLPTDGELQLFGALRHDVNLGTTNLAPLLNDSLLAAFQVTQSLPDACIARDPPMWLAGSFAAISPAHNYLYLLFGCNALPADIFGDVKCGDIDVIVVDATGQASTVRVGCHRTGFGEMRIRIPLSRGMAIRAVTVPVARLAREAIVSGPFLQSGASVRQALRDGHIVLLQPPQVRRSAMTGSGRYYAADADDAALVIDLAASDAAVTVLSIGLTPLEGGRILALD
jgi:FMN phosphatase YigB (HAD superfamily)